LSPTKMWGQKAFLRWLVVSAQRRTMGILLSTYATGRDNNFNLIRFIAASLVLFSHSFALTLGSGDAEPLRSTIGMTLGSIAVDIFFITSGFLITSSYSSRKNLLSFVWARVVRIYPALMVAIVFCVFVVGAYFSALSIQEYLINHQTYKYFVKNTIIFLGIEDRLPGVFLDVPYKGAVNGSLWALPYVVGMYAILAIILGLIAYIGKWVKFITVRNIILLIGLFSFGLNIFNHFQAALPIAIVHLFSMFFVGAAFFVWRDKVRLSSKWAFLGLSLLLMSSINKDLFFTVYCLVLPFLIIYAAYVPSGVVRRFNRCGDYSYGIYIYAFPIQQSLAQMVPNITVPMMIAASFSVTLFFAMLSWHLIEKRFLKKKGAYIVIENFVKSVEQTRHCARTK
jgi:peptidoglycan/LPS O-acetylase OafA/YrhL